VLYGFFQNIAMMWSDLSDPRATQGCAVHLSDIIDFLRKEGRKLTALAV